MIKQNKLKKTGSTTDKNTLAKSIMEEATIGKTTSLIINEVQLILAEKRTSLALLRTGIAVFALPLSALSFLIATSRYYDITHVIPLFVPLIVINTALLILGSYLIIRAIMRIHRYDQLIKDLKLKHSVIADLVD